MKIAISVFFLIFLNSNVKAEDICRPAQFNYFDTTIQTGFFTQTNRCYISITPRYAPNLVYRSHLFTSNGEHMIFNSFGNGPASTDTGAKVFLYLPRISPMDYILKDAKITLSLSNKAQIIFDAKSSLIIDSIDIDIQETPTINRGNMGGVDVYSAQNTWIDFGFTLGHSPLWDLNGSHMIHLGDKSCSAQNFELLYKQNGEIFWRYNTDQALIQKLESLCELN